MRFVLLFVLLWSSTTVVAQTTRSCDDTTGVVCIEIVQDANGIQVFGLNGHSHMPITLELAMTTQNMAERTGAGNLQTLPPNARVPMGQWSPVTNAAWRYNYTFHWTAGDFRARHDPSTLYRLPYPADRIFEIVQGCHGDFSHQDHARYSIDFGFTLDQPIVAARAGQVVFVKEDSNRGGPDRAYIDDGNFVSILHEDGSIARYFHIRVNGVAPELGTFVQAGDLLGYSGNTGFSTGPHLHFEVIVAETGQDFHSVPITWDTAQGAVTCPREGLYLQVAE